MSSEMSSAWYHGGRDGLNEDENEFRNFEFLFSSPLIGIPTYTS